MESVNVLVVDDEEVLVKALEKLVRREGLTFAGVKTGVEAVEYLVGHRVDVVFVDLNLSGTSGLQLLDYIKTNNLETEVILMTGKGTIETAVAALKRGAYDYLTKPFEDIERVSVIIHQAMEKVDLLRKIKNLELDGGEEDHYLDIIGKSAKMRDIYRLIERVASSNSSVANTFLHQIPHLLNILLA